LETLADTTNDHFCRPTQPMEHVTTLELALNTSESNEVGQIDCNNLMFLYIYYLPNVTDLVLNRLPTKNTNSLFKIFHNLRRVTWSGAILYLNGSDFHGGPPELILDRCHFVLERSGTGMLNAHRMVVLEVLSDNAATTNAHIFTHSRNLERLSIKDATWSTSTSDQAPPAEPLPQEWLIKMVRHHPTLRWLRSDLSPENVAMLQREKPEITFVTD